MNYNYYATTNGGAVAMVVRRRNIKSLKNVFHYNCFRYNYAPAVPAKSGRSATDWKSAA